MEKDINGSREKDTHGLPLVRPVDSETDDRKKQYLERLSQLKYLIGLRQLENPNSTLHSVVKNILGKVGKAVVNLAIPPVFTGNREEILIKIRESDYKSSIDRVDEESFIGILEEYSAAFPKMKHFIDKIVDLIINYSEEEKRISIAIELKEMLETGKWVEKKIDIVGRITRKNEVGKVAEADRKAAISPKEKKKILSAWKKKYPRFTIEGAALEREEDGIAELKLDLELNLSLNHPNDAVDFIRDDYSSASIDLEGKDVMAELERDLKEKHEQNKWGIDTDLISSKLLLNVVQKVSVGLSVEKKQALINKYLQYLVEENAKNIIGYITANFEDVSTGRLVFDFISIHLQGAGLDADFAHLVAEGALDLCGSGGITIVLRLLATEMMKDKEEQSPSKIRGLVVTLVALVIAAPTIKYYDQLSLIFSGSRGKESGARDAGMTAARGGLQPREVSRMNVAPKARLRRPPQMSEPTIRDIVRKATQAALRKSGLLGMTTGEQELRDENAGISDGRQIADGGAERDNQIYKWEAFRSEKAADGGVRSETGTASEPVFAQEVVSDGGEERTPDPASDGEKQGKDGGVLAPDRGISPVDARVKPESGPELNPDGGLETVPEHGPEPTVEVGVESVSEKAVELDGKSVPERSATLGAEKKADTSGKAEVRDEVNPEKSGESTAEVEEEEKTIEPVIKESVPERSADGGAELTPESGPEINEGGVNDGGAEQIPEAEKEPAIEKLTEAKPERVVVAEPEVESHPETKPEAKPEASAEMKNLSSNGSIVILQKLLYKRGVDLYKIAKECGQQKQLAIIYQALIGVAPAGEPNEEEKAEVETAVKKWINQFGSKGDGSRKKIEKNLRGLLCS
ncbi:hypothetical protein KKG71_01165 [Patescibacteria group bacterium]|nr:hypothetical protein [Patescibacteria group bacterium]